MQTRNNTMTNPRILSAGTIKDDPVVNDKGENLGNIEEIMINLGDGKIAYAVLSFGGFLGMGDKLFAIPWEALTLDSDNHRFILNVDKERLQRAEGFDKDNWPDFADREWGERVYQHYGYTPYWQR